MFLQRTPLVGALRTLNYVLDTRPKQLAQTRHGRDDAAALVVGPERGQCLSLVIFGSSNLCSIQSMGIR